MPEIAGHRPKIFWNFLCKLTLLNVLWQLEVDRTSGTNALLI